MKIRSIVLIILVVCFSGVSCGRAVSPVALKHAAEGQRLYELMQYEDAIKEYNEAVKAQPSFALAYLGIGRCLADSEKFDEALRQYKRALDLDPKNDEIMYEIARTYIEKGLGDEGLLMLDRAKDRNPRNPKLFLYRGIYYYNSMQYTLAIDEFMKAAKEDSKSPEPYIKLSLLYINANNPSYQNGEKAVEYAQKAVDLAPDSLKALDTLANAYFFAGRYDLAEETAMVALEKSPDNPILEESLMRFRSTVKGSADEHNLKGAELLDSGDYGGAAEEFKMAIDIDPDFSDGYYNLGKVYSQIQDYNQALASYKKAIELNPDNPRYHYNMAIVYGLKGMSGESEQEYLMAISLDPYYDKAHNNLGALYVKTDKLNEALAEFDKAFEINPRSDYKNNSDMVRKMMEERGLTPKPVISDKAKSQY
ncbi:MAG: tetratricopeptide repeat protein [Deltaproteobacteria bacterium]|nr:tetratricopeptide repeat protein [Candidatus Zymogenaceae bacterium]